ncbi:hypothetical protein O1611_g5560 [Lasiodiplodia mahajangana]|uniref:Uncharacterized protein n=1 Tax=Lasiodiplodia mahajangana TaxID=1108764 RepID=A0ACC2JKL0_9PEZI|nr:hypothetical protein O1611_g5560 [Lasiodiplodia mahajangana]
MNAELASKAETPRLPQGQTTVTTRNHASPTTLRVSFTPRLLIQPSEKWNTRALSHFLHNYSCAPTRDSPGYLGFLPDLLRNGSSRAGYLESAVLAAGSASLANISGLTHLERTAEKHYGETLRSLSVALKSPAEASSDSALTCIIVLQTYEAITGIRTLSCNPHAKGLVELLRLRGSSRPGTSSGNDLLRIIHSRVHMNSVGGLSPSRIDAQDVKAVDLPPHQVKLWRLIREISQRCVDAQGAISIAGQSVFKSEVIKSLDHVLLAYLSLLNWQMDLPSTWSYQSYKTSAQDDHDTQQGDFPGKYHVFKNIHYGAMWISFWCTLIYALQTLVHVSSLSVVQHVFNPGWDLRKRLRDAVDEICACVPYMMADVDQSGLPIIGKDGKALGAFLLLRGLYVAICVEEISSAQREYILRTLLRIAHAKGIKLALRPRDRWFSEHSSSESHY